MRTSRLAFTVVELITVMSIIGILAVIALPTFTETVPIVPPCRRTVSPMVPPFSAMLEDATSNRSTPGPSITSVRVEAEPFSLFLSTSVLLTRN